MRRIYADLNLGSFNAVRPALKTYLQEHRTYEPNVHHLSPSQRAEVERRRRWYFERYGGAGERAELITGTEFRTKTKCGTLRSAGYSL
jgi:hypothetical protein